MQQSEEFAEDPMRDAFPDASEGNIGEPASKDQSPFQFLDAHTHINEDNVTAILLVPFTPAQDKILVIDHLNRGIDIPSGHVEDFDKTYFDTARRELFEETGATIGHVTPIMIMQSQSYEHSEHNNEPSYMVVLTGTVSDLGVFEQTDEIQSRHFLSPEEFLEAYEGDHPGDMQKIIAHALATIDNKHGAAPEIPEQ